MSCEIRRTVQTTEAALVGVDLQVEEIRSDVRVKIPAGHRVEVELLGQTVEFATRPLNLDGDVDWENPHREIISVCFWSGGAGAIASAVVQYVARKHDSTTSSYSSEAEKLEAVALLHRVAGAMGLSLSEPLAAVTAGGCDA